MDGTFYALTYSAKACNYLSQFLPFLCGEFLKQWWWWWWRGEFEEFLSFPITCLTLPPPSLLLCSKSCFCVISTLNFVSVYTHRAHESQLGLWVEKRQACVQRYALRGIYTILNLPVEYKIKPGGVRGMRRESFDLSPRLLTASLSASFA